MSPGCMAFPYFSDFVASQHDISTTFTRVYDLITNLSSVYIKWPAYPNEPAPEKIRVFLYHINKPALESTC